MVSAASSRDIVSSSIVRVALSGTVQLDNRHDTHKRYNHEMMTRIRARFRRLRWKLTWSYTWVAALTFFIIEAVLLVILFSLLGVNPLQAGSGLLHEELLPSLADSVQPITAFHLRQKPPDPAALQADLEQIMSDMPFSLSTRPFESDHVYSVFVLDAEQRLLASVPQYAMLPPDGRLFDTTVLVGDEALVPLIEAAYAGDNSFPQPVVYESPQALYLITGDPIHDDDGELVGVQVAIIRAPTGTALLLLALRVIVGGLIIFSLAAALMGTLFGWRTARKLSERLAHLSQTMAAWGQGDFEQNIMDNEEDEIGELGQNLNRVATDLKTLLADKEQIAILEERDRLARELHDTLAQGVAGLILQLEAIKHHLSAEEVPESQMIVSEATKRARDALHDARAAIDDLRAEVVFATDFITAVSRKAQQFSTVHNISWELDAQLPDSLLLPPTISLHARRALAEMLTNVARHSGATELSVRLRLANGSLLVEVADDGQGFDVETAIRPGHYGIVGLKERARLTGGQLAIDSAPGKGTTVQLHLPLENTG